jgi:hypothetical protein
MNLRRKRPGRKKGGAIRFPGLIADARSLHRNPSHLWRCLVGQRTGKRLVAAYSALKASQNQKPHEHQPTTNMNTPKNSPSSVPSLVKLSAAAAKSLPGYIGGPLTTGQALHAQRAESGNYDILAGGATIARPPGSSSEPAARPYQSQEAARVSRGRAITASAIGGTVSGGQAINPSGGK